MKNFIYGVLITLFLAVPVLAIDQSGTFTISRLGLNGTVAIDEETTVTLRINQTGVNAVAPLLYTAKTTATLAWSDGTTGTFTITAADRTTGSLLYAGDIPGYFSNLTTDTVVTPVTSYFKTNRLSNNCYFIDWKAASNGAIAGTITIEGLIEQVRFSNGATEPSALYDVTITDAWGYDVLAANGANITTGTAGVAKVPYVTVNSDDYLIPTVGSHDVAITNAGNGGSGYIKIFVRP